MLISLTGPRFKQTAKEKISAPVKKRLLRCFPVNENFLMLNHPVVNSYCNTCKCFARTSVILYHFSLTMDNSSNFYFVGNISRSG